MNVSKDIWMLDKENVFILNVTNHISTPKKTNVMPVTIHAKIVPDQKKTNVNHVEIDTTEN